MISKRHSSRRQTMSEAMRRWALLSQLTAREVETRYRGAGLGLVWTVLTPLMMLLVYTFVFGTVFKSRWSTSGDSASSMEFAVILFSGLILFQLFSDVVTRAPTLILSNPTLVKKVVFPLELLVPVTLGAAFFHAAVSLLVLIPFVGFVFGSVPATLAYLPLVVIPLGIMILGIGWFLASIGTFIRDVGQIVGTITTAMLFMSPVFFPLTALPEWIRPFLFFNPMTVPIEQMRRILIFGQAPEMMALGVYSAAALIVALGGYIWFEKTRKGFADVL